MLRELYAKSIYPSQEDKESAVHVLASIIEQAKSIGHAHASRGEERGMAWGGNFLNALSSAWNIVNNFVQRIADWISGSEDLTPEDVQAEVDSLAETVAGTEVAAAIEQEVMDELSTQGFLQISWIATPGACQLCLDNAAASPIPIGTAFPSGDLYPPGHPRCRCSLGSPGEK